MGKLAMSMDILNIASIAMQQSLPEGTDHG